MIIRCMLASFALLLGASCGGSSELTDEETVDLVRSYYATEGEFAGTFEVLSVDCLRDADEADDDVFDIDVSYHFCTPDDCALPRAAGADIRRFSFGQDDGYDWQVVSMAAAGSGTCIDLPEGVDPPDNARINTEIPRFYGTLSEFAGTFEILSMDCGTLDDRNGAFVVDSGYSFCSPDNCAAGASDGSDVREFDLVLIGGEWTAVSMGGALSGQCL